MSQSTLQIDMFKYNNNTCVVQLQSSQKYFTVLFKVQIPTGDEIVIYSLLNLQCDNVKYLECLGDTLLGH